MPVRKASFGLCVALISSILYLVLHYITNLIYQNVQQPYMDEIFHIPQAKLYCSNNFTYYDPKITTPPGLYLISYARIWLRDKILMRRLELVCDIMDLRRTNHLIAIANFVILNLIQLSTGNKFVRQHQRHHYYTIEQSTRHIGFRQRILFTMNTFTTIDLAKIILTSLAITILPPLFFFNSLYYTDAGSLLFTLLGYLFSLNDHHWLASIFGIISILFRQTNIVWLFYSACLVILRTYKGHQTASTSKHHRRPSSASIDQTNVVDSNSSILTNLHCILLDRSLIFKLIKNCLPYSIVGMSFIAFIIHNNGIVLGDKEAHQAKLHFAQILYFLGFCSVFGTSWMFHMRILRRFLYFTIRSPLTAIIACLLILYLIAFGRYAHPYLLADNRHIAFYIWRRILDRHNSYVPYLLTPVYLISSLSIWHHLRLRGCKQMLLFIFCTLLVIVPNGLLEPRYFIIPFIFLRLQSTTESTLVSLFIELSQNLLINVGMYYLFLFKTFHWADSTAIQRIMW